MIHFLTIGTILGLSAGFAPGPLLTLVITETLRHNIRSGIKVALAPIITDLPIILITLLVLTKLAAFHSILGVITLLGGIFVFYMGVESLRTKSVDLALQDEKPRSLLKGALTNALSPHPYLFWFSVGAPTMTRAMESSTTAAAAFLFGFYFFLIGAKIFLAVLSGKSRRFLQGKSYMNTMRLLGLVLCGLALVLLRDGLVLLGVL